MRKILISVLMASALMPAAANADPGDRGPREHRERSESNDNSSNNHPQHVQRIEQSNSDGPRIHIERADRSQRVERSVESQQNDQTRFHRFERHDNVQQTQQVEQIHQTERRDNGFVGAITHVGREQSVQQQSDVQVHRDRDGFSGLHDRIVRNGDRIDGNHRWSRDWRNDHRYDWRNYRNRYSSLFRLGRYYDPYGWNYSRFSIGYNLWPSYYGSNYWLNDPWQYRLPPAYGPYRWVRYYDDALLVNIYTGQVVDVLYNFFW